MRSFAEKHAEIEKSEEKLTTRGGNIETTYRIDYTVGMFIDLKAKTYDEALDKFESSHPTDAVRSPGQRRL